MMTIQRKERRKFSDIKTNNENKYFISLKKNAISLKKITNSPKISETIVFLYSLFSLIIIFLFYLLQLHFIL